MVKPPSLTEKTLLETATTVVGVVAGMAVGSKLGSTEFGAYVGAVITPALNNLSMQMLSPRQAGRVETVRNIAQEKIKKTLEAGTQFRTDVSKDQLLELSEGTLIASRDSYEERKIPLLANLVANAPFSKLPINDMMCALNIGEKLSYRQLCVIGAIGINIRADTTLFVAKEVKDFFDNESNHLTMGVLQDVMLLQRQGIIEQRDIGPDPTKIDPAIAMGNIVPNSLRLSYLGWQIFNLMELSKTDGEVMTEVITVLDGSIQAQKSNPAKSAITGAK